ncbi:MAG: transcription-repair coupling factor [Bacteroidaceae bacterium]|nr:transcription-repair coupling factor [Bacteroidaceae bacterium]
MNNLLTLYAQSPAARRLHKLITDSNARRVAVDGIAVPSALALLWACRQQCPTTLFIMDDADEAGYFYHDLTQMLGNKRVLFFPSSYKRKVRYGQKDAANEILRTEVMAKLSSIDPENHAGQDSQCIVVSYAEAISELVVSNEKLTENTIVLHTDDTVKVSELSQSLRKLGFMEVDYVYEPGQFAIRGSIVDIFSYSSEFPFRIDFFGDDIDSLRTFEVESQLSRDRITQIEIVPEMDEQETERVSILKFLPADAIIATRSIAYTRDTIARIYQEGFDDKAIAEKYETATEMEQADLMKELSAKVALLPPTLFEAQAQNFRIFEIGRGISETESIPTSRQSGSPTARKNKPSHTITCRLRPQPLFHKNFDLLFADLKSFLENGYRLYILADSPKQQERLKEIFAPQDISFISVDKTIHEGYIDNEAKLCLFTDHQIFDRFHKYSLKSDTARRGKAALTMKELQEMEVGDYVIHVDLGIGKFAGLVRIPQGDSYREVIRIIYQNNDKVDVSIHSLYKISKYKRGDAEQPPRLSTLGTGAWDRLKEKAKKRIKDIARDLIRLYAARRHKKGFAFSPDNYLQHALEASFIYEDTPDQLKATQDVKADMESDKPMDRLVCGDVGFGKTEVAMRAAFKAATDGKQTAVMVPTTVLAYQHYLSFSKRMKDMPVKVDYLSRARSAKQTKEILKELEEGKTDIIIGTHKLISKQVKFHDLGLLIIDEEQKFGVSTKESLKKMKVNIDTLTMSATPIPRTLQFSLMGARDMSIIQTPPPNRYPVATEIHTFDKDVIVDAIEYEMSRNGQVFFVSNRIGSLDELRLLIEKYIPDCRVATGHGQMKPDELEKIILGFINYDYDVLISTTILENGIDVGNANTIIINNAHHFGLSDLHQMRGRVGRSNKKAYCYLLAPPLAALPPDARRRLEALETFSDLGSGFNISMQDLDIRGAGNLLGAEQSGFMEDLGYETYHKILNQAVAELKNEEFSDIFNEELKAKGTLKGEYFVDDCAIESDFEMFFPEMFVPGSAERMLLYRELDKLKTDRELDDYRKRLKDRFGELPREAEALLLVVPLRRLGKQFGCEKIILKEPDNRKGKDGKTGKDMRMQFVANEDSPFYQSDAFGKLLNYMVNNPRRCHLQDKPRRVFIVNGINSMDEAVNLLKQINES